MSQEITKNEPKEIDGFAGYEDRIEGDDQRRGGGVIQGRVVKFTNEAEWVLRDGEEVPPDLELVVVDIGRVIQKWKDQKPIETTILEPGQKFPDVEALNEATPRSEWTKGPDGKPTGPYQKQHIVYLLDMRTMDRFSYPTGTTGGAIAVRELVDKTKWMRRFRGPSIHPVVTLSDIFMNTKFGGRQRPHFFIKKWIDLGGGGGEMQVLPAPKAPTLAPAAVLDQFAAGAEQTEKAAEAAAAASPYAPLKTVTEPGLGEQMNDEIPF